MKVTDGVYAYLWTNLMENNCNTYALQGAGGIVLIDPGLQQYIPRVLDQMRADGLDPGDIRMVLATHGHPDHIDGVAAFKDAPDISIAMHAREEEFLGEIGREFFRMFGLPEPEFTIDTRPEEGPLQACGMDLQVLCTPGHSPGSICIHWPERATLVTGDVVFSGSIGRTDFPGGSGHVLKESIEKISGIPVEHLLPGHNELVQGADLIARNFDFIKRSFFDYL